MHGTRLELRELEKPALSGSAEKKTFDEHKGIICINLVSDSETPSRISFYGRKIF